MSTSLLQLAFIPSSIIFRYPIGQLEGVGYPSMLKILYNWSILLVPGNRGLPKYNSTITHPREKTSIAVEYYLVPNKFSGALYHLVAI